MRRIASVAIAVAVGAVVVGACGKRDRDREPAPTKPDVVAAPVVPDARPPDCDHPGGLTCHGDDVVECLADGSYGRTAQQCDGACKAGACVDTCAVHDVELVYVIDDRSTLMSFDPLKLPGDPFRVIATLTCDTASSPFSMAVDRKGIAWVLYQTGVVYRVSIIDGTCSAPVFTATGGVPTHFGMGFVTDGKHAETEKLFVAGDDLSHPFAQLDVSYRPARWTPVGKVVANQARNPELTGTGDGVLYGYFPEVGNGFIQELDRKTGKAVGKRLDLGGGTQLIHAWAFAHWGGVFYVFAADDDQAVVHAVNRKTGEHHIVIPHLEHDIVGAGVSTCAPLLERVP